MVDGESLEVRLVDGIGSARLCLQGSVLTFCHSGWLLAQMIDIPLELVFIERRRQLRGRFLFAAVLSLPLGLALGGAALGIWYAVQGDVPDPITAVAMCTGAAFGALLFLIFLIRFFMRQDAVVVRLEPERFEATVQATKERQQSLGAPAARIRAPLGLKKRVLIDFAVVVLTLPALALVSPWLVSGFLVGYLLFQQLRRVPTLTRIDRPYCGFSFWVESNQRRETEEMLAEIQRRQRVATESTPAPVDLPLRVIPIRPWRLTLAIAALCSIPAMSLENPRLLFLCAVPIGAHLLSSLLHLFEPEPYRTAVRLYRHGNWDAAYAAAMSFVEIMPGHRGTRVLLVETLMQQDRFDEAENELSKAVGVLDDYSNQSLRASLDARREMARRKGACP